jgi:hypothetical protein
VLLNEAAVKQEGLRLGLVKGKQEMTEQQKVQARASLIMQQTTLAQGPGTTQYVVALNAAVTPANLKFKF